MQTRPFLPGFVAKLFGGSSKKQHEPPPQSVANSIITPPLPEPREAKPFTRFYAGNRRTRQRLARSPGICRVRKVRQILTDPKYMHSSQRARFAKGETIYV